MQNVTEIIAGEPLRRKS